ncbi:COX15/CtaA family protein [Sphingomonas bacterium]|uniref:COX15/CtaA family protein n=1 Tax=Sphingomonas bacterium TaxID=1895847 RepID=UPI001575BFE2|nr:COX15/CtaA family protein [Sphingomonas bacterium]
MLQVSRSFVTTARPALLARWLYIVAALIVAMVVVGGITRLTESGLSMTTWQPLTGAIPPITDAQWQAEFSNYRRIPQYAELNAGMTLAGFKSIFFWEYLHRLMARVVVTAMIVPLIWFAVRRRIPVGYGARLCTLVALLALQAAAGWWMVSSGLQERTEVSHLRLATHLLLAMFTLAGTIWTALDLASLSRGPVSAPARLRWGAAGVVVLLFVQLMYGAFTAGLRAGYAFSSWPLMSDRLFPQDVPMTTPAWINGMDNPIVVQFIHRWLAFAVAGALGWLAFRAFRIGAAGPARAVVLLVSLQIALGVSTLMSGVAIPIAVAHQANAALLVIAAVAAAHAIGRRTA